MKRKLFLALAVTSIAAWPVWAADHAESATVTADPAADIADVRRQQANLTEPSDDGQYAAEYTSTLRTLHFELAPAFASLGLAQCGVAGASADTNDVSKCLAQAGPVVIPDILTLDSRQPSGFPNGRDADDQVVDLVLAVALIDLSNTTTGCFGGPCSLRTLANLPLNPGMSTPRPLTAFPFLNNVALAAPPPASP